MHRNRLQTASKKIAESETCPNHPPTTSGGGIHSAIHFTSVHFARDDFDSIRQTERGETVEAAESECTRVSNVTHQMASNFHRISVEFS